MADIKDMDSFFELCDDKTNQIQTSLLDMMSTLIRYNKKRTVDGQRVNTEDKVIVGKIYLERIEAFVAKTAKNVSQLTTLVDKTLSDKEQMTQQLNQCLKREVQYKKTLEEVRRQYQIVKEKLQQKEIIEEMFGSTNGQTSGQRYCQLNDYFKNSLALVLHSTTNGRNVQSITENQEIFNTYMSSLLNVVQKYIEDQLADELDADPNPYEPTLIETICGICVNVFLYSEFLCQDINIWIQSLTSLQVIDKRFLKNVIMALHNICFNSDGHEEVAKQKGVVEMMAKVVVDPDFKYDFKIKTYAVKAIARMLQMSRGKGIDILLYNEFIDVMPVDRFNQMAYNELNIGLRKAMLALKSSLSQIDIDTNIEL